MRGASLAVVLLMVVPQAEVWAQTKPATSQEIERQMDHDLWIEVRDSNNPKLLEDYLEKFPHGIYAVVAREKLGKLWANTAGAGPVAPEGSAPPAVAPKPPDALELLHRVQAAMGGAERLASIRNYRHVENQEGLRGGPGTTTWCATGMSLGEQGRSKYYHDSRAPGWIYEKGAIAELSVGAGKSEAFMDLINLVLADRMNYAISLDGPSAIKIADGEGRTAVLEVDASSGLPRHLAPLGFTYSDWRESGGVKVPFLRTITRSAGPPVKLTTLSWKLNTAVNCLELGHKPEGARQAKPIPTLPAPDPASVLPRMKGDTSAQAIVFLKKLQERLGGVEALMNVTDYERVYQEATPTMRGMAKEHKLVDRGCITGETLIRPASPLIHGRELFFNGNDAGWLTVDGKQRPLTSGEIAKYRRDAFNYDFFKLVLSDRDPDRTLSMVDEATIQIADSHNNEVRITVDAADGLPKMKVSRFKSSAPVQEELSDWKPVGRIQLPFHLKGYRVTSAGRAVLLRDVVIQEWKPNIGIDCAQLGARKR